ncbi:MAG: hypothetical protein NVS4B8_11010 [Herpetosiphon sp.]
MDNTMAGPLTSAESHGTKARHLPKNGNSTFVAALVSSAPFMPGLAGVFTVLAYILRVEPTQWWVTLMNDSAVPIGIVSALFCWTVCGLLFRSSTTADRANTRVYGVLCTHVGELDAQINGLGPVQEAAITGDQLGSGLEELSRLKAMAHHEVILHRNVLTRQLGLDGHDRTGRGLEWTLSTGYLELWNRLHRAEEALLLLEPNAAVVSGAMYDELCLAGSSLSRADDLVAESKRCREALSRCPCLDGSATSPGVNEKKADGDLQMQWEIRARLRQIKRVLKEFQDDSRDGLVRVRNRVNRTSAFTGLAMYVIVCLAITMHAPVSMIVAAATYYLVGAIIGLFSRLRIESESETAVEDYGLSATRLVHRPLFSGLAAIGGVVLVAMLSGALTSSIVPAAGKMPTPTAGANVLVPLGEIFDLDKYPFGLILSALFGFAPSLFVQRLEQEANKYRVDLKSSSSTARSQIATK